MTVGAGLVPAHQSREGTRPAPTNEERNMNGSFSKSIFAMLILATLMIVIPSSLFAAAKKNQAVPLPSEITILAAETNKPVSGAVVDIAFENMEAKPFATLTTDDSGKVVTQLARGSYRYLVRARGFGVTSGYLYVEPGTEKPSAGSWLNRAASISGRLVDSTGKPMAGVWLMLGRIHRCVTDNNGRFSFTELDAHGHNLVSAHEGWTLEKAMYPQVEAGEKKELGDVVLKRAASLKATLKLQDTTRIPVPAGITLSVSGNGLWKSIKTDNDGVIRVTGMPPGTYTVATSDNRLKPSEKKVTLAEGGTSELVVETAPRPPSLEIEEYGDIFLPEKALKMKAYGLWVTEATATIFKVPKESITDGPKLLSSVAGMETRGLNIARQFKVSFKKGKNDNHNRGRFKLPPLAPGPYILTLEGSGASSRIAFLVTRLGLVAKVSPDSIMLFASDLVTGKPMPGVTLQVRVDDKSIKTLTGADGTALFEKKKNTGIIAGSDGENLALLPLATEEAPEAPSEFKGYIYTERTAYRPGQKVYYKGVLRKLSNDSYRMPDIKTVHIKVTDSGDKLVHESDLAMSGKGSFNGNFDLAARPTLGEYSITASAGEEQWRGSFKVLEYRKPEFELKLSPQGPHHLSGSKVPVRLAGRYYFGAPVAGAKVTWRAYTSPFAPDPDDSAGGQFGDEQENYAGYGEFVGEGEATLDSSGEVLLQIPAKSHEFPTVYQIEADVADSSSRQVSGSASFTVVPSLLDLRIRGEEYLLKPGQDTGFRVRVSDWQGRPQKAVSVFATLNESIYDKKSRKSIWRETGKLYGTTDAQGSVRLASSFPRTGHWKVVARANDKEGRASIQETSTWVWRYGSQWEGSYRELEAEFDKKVYKPGDRARLIVKSPASGATLLLTIEGRRIHRRSLVRLDGAVQVIEIPVTEELAPNIYVSAVVIHGGRFFQQTGLLKVDHEPGKLSLDLKADKDIYAPGDTARITIKTTVDKKPAKSELSLAVVDEAIFAVAPERRDDIYRFFKGRREHLVTTIHSFPRLYLGGASKDAALRGEDDELKGIKVRKVFKDTAGWFPMLDAASDGIVTAEVQLPDNLTTWRATAVGHTEEQQFGSASTKFIAKLPFMARLSPPRFFIEGDSLQVPGTVTDTTGTEQQVTARFEASGLTISGESSFKATLAPDASMRKDVSLKAGPATEATIKLTAKGTKGADAMELVVPVLHRGLPREVAGAISLTETSAETNLKLPDDQMPGSAILTTTFSPTAAYSIVPALERLIAFPYGCVEQTMSRFLPAAYTKSLISRGGWDIPKNLESKLPSILSEGMKHLQELQHQDGGWGWWKNDKTSPELTAMVLSGLATAKKAGLDLDDSVIKRGLKSAEKQFETSTPLQSALLYRAVTAHGSRNEVAEKKISASVDKLPLNGKIAWADSLANTGRAPESAALLEALKKQLKEDGAAAYISDENLQWRWGGSTLETTSALLSSLLRVAPKDPFLPRLADYIQRKQAGGWWHTTALSSAAVMALADFVGSTGEKVADYRAELLHNGKPVASWKVEKGRITDGSPTVSIPASKGNNIIRLLRDKPEGTARLALSIGYRVAPESATSVKGLSLERNIYRIKSVKDGEAWRHEYTPLKQGEAVTAGEDLEVRLVVTNDQDLEYLILEDRLPAGFEVRQADRDPRYSGQSWYRGWYDHKERRDATVAWFMGRLSAGRHEFRSVIYPELTGTALALPASVWPMYRPEFRSESAPWQVNIR